MPADDSRQSSASASPEVEDFYKLLGVAYTATQKEIVVAYRGAMKRYHPDRVRPERRYLAEERSKLLNQAYRTLSNPAKKREYDQLIKSSAIQEQIMGRYVGGFATSTPGGDQYAEALRQRRTPADRASQKRADRSATVSILIAFAGIALVVIALLLAWSGLSALIDAVT